MGVPYESRWDSIMRLRQKDEKSSKNELQKHEQQDDWRRRTQRQCAAPRRVNGNEQSLYSLSALSLRTADISHYGESHIDTILLLLSRALATRTLSPAAEAGLLATAHISASPNCIPSVVSPMKSTGTRSLIISLRFHRMRCLITLAFSPDGDLLVFRN